MRRTAWVWCAMALGATVLLAVGPAAAQDRDLDRERLRLQEQLREDAGLSDAQWVRMETDVDAFLRGGGQGQEVRRMVRDAQAAGCQGECLAETVRSMNRARAHGLSGAQAREMVTAEFQAQVRERSERGESPGDPELGRKLRERVENALIHRERGAERRGEDSPSGGRAGSGAEPHGNGSRDEDGRGSGRGGSRGGRR